jgi:hypothetical protein
MEATMDATTAAMRAPRHLLLVALMLAACSRTPTEPVDAVLSFDIEGAWEGTALSLTWIEPGVDIDEVDSLMVLFEGAVTGPSYGIDPGELPAEHLLEDEDLTLALYVPTLFADTDGDGTHDEGEFYLGVSRHWPLWIEGAPPAEYAELGLVAGWNAIELELDEENNFGGDPIVHDPLAIPLMTSLLPIEEITIGGGYTGTEPVDDQRLTFAPHSALWAGDLTHADPLYDEPVVEPWGITVSGAPPQSHQIDPDGFPRATNYAVSYVDSDGSGGPSEGEPPVNMACVGSDFVAVSWMAPPTTVRMAAHFEYLFSPDGLPPGWSARAVDPDTADFRALDAAEVMDLELTNTCMPWG